MKIFDCTMYHKEDLILDIRFKLINKYIDKLSYLADKKNLNFLKNLS